MDIVKRTAANTFWLLLAQIMMKGSALLVAILLTRYLGPEGFGAYAFVCAYVGFFVVLTDLGMDLFVTREAACDLKGVEELAGKGIAAKAVLSLLACLLSVGIALGLGLPGGKVLLIGIASTGLLLAPFTLYGAAFSAVLQLRYTAVFEMCGRLLMVGLLASVILLKGSLPAIFVALVLPGVAVAALNVIYGRRLFRPKLSFDWKGIRGLLIRTLPIALGLFCVQVLMRIDQVMLEWLRSDHELGLYSTGVKCCEALNILPAVVMTSIFPLLSRAARSGLDEEFLKVCSLSYRFLSLVLFPAVLVLFLYPGPILSFLFGTEFAPGAMSLRILCWSVPLMAMGYVLMCAAIAANHLRVMFLLCAWLAATNTILNLVLVPQRAWFGGGNGAALATVLSLVGLAALAPLSRGPRPVVAAFLRSAVRPAAALVPAGLAVSLAGLSAVPGGVVAVFLYACVMVLLRGVNRADTEWVVRISWPG